MYLSLDSYSLSVDVGPVVHFSSAETAEINAVSKLLTFTIIVFCSLYLIVYSLRILKEGLSLFWAWIDVMQLYNLCLFIDTHLFENVASILRKCEYLNLWFPDFLASLLGSSAEQLL